MSIDLKVPPVGESITEVEIANWLKSEGEFIEKDQPLVVLETDKATVEIPAPASGRLEKILKNKGGCHGWGGHWKAGCHGCGRR